MNEQKRAAKMFRREMIACIIVLVFLLAFGIILMVAMMSSNSAKGQPPPLPKPVYTNNHGQSLVMGKSRDLDLLEWMKAHPNARIISIAVSRFSYFVLYEEADEKDG